MTPTQIFQSFNNLFSYKAEAQQYAARGDYGDSDKKQYSLGAEMYLSQGFLISDLLNEKQLICQASPHAVLQKPLQNLCALLSSFADGTVTQVRVAEILPYFEDCHRVFRQFLVFGKVEDSCGQPLCLQDEASRFLSTEGLICFRELCVISLTC